MVWIFSAVEERDLLRRRTKERKEVHRGTHRGNTSKKPLAVKIERLIFMSFLPAGLKYWNFISCCLG